MTRVREMVSHDAPDVDDALRRLERVESAARSAGLELDTLSDEALTILRLACQRAPYAATLLARDPTRLGRVADDGYIRREKPARVQRQELAAVLEGCPGDDDAELSRRLRAYRADEMVRLAAREMGFGNRAEVGRELAHLADVSFDAAIAHHDAALSARYGEPRYTGDDGAERRAELCVIGMGKLGGEELNFSSDVDVIYVYSSDNGSAGDLTLHEYFCKLCERVTRSIGEVTPADFVYRVDLRLRPEGSRGAIANSLPSTERYYESWGRPWERQAWLKARPSSGSLELGAEVMDTLRPFVYPRTTSPSVIDEVADLNRRIKAELDVGGVESGFDLKNGVGGIREVEFFVQALQLVHSGRHPHVRARGTLAALDQLLFAGFISEAEHRELVPAYRFLRHLEHILQLESGRQTQRLPSNADELHLVARRAGCRDADHLRASLRAHTTVVSGLFATLGEPAGGPPPEVVALLAGQLSDERERAIMSELGFRDPDRAYRNLELARHKPLSPFHPAATGAGARVAAALLADLCTSPDPDQALSHVVDLISKRGSWSSMWALFDQNPVLMQLIASLFGTSEFLSKSFVAHPEMIDALLQTGRARSRTTTEELRATAEASLAGGATEDPQDSWDRLAELKQNEVLRIGLADIGGDLEPDETSRELSVLAEVVLERAHSLVAHSIVERHGTPRLADGAPAPLAILGMGKLGAFELGYASDLDLIFVYEGAGDSDGPRPIDIVTYMTRVAQRLMSGLHALHPGGRLYEVDTRLRPSGSKGLLVSTMAAWEKYHRGDARLWERQALIKLRPVAGNAALGYKVARAAADYVYGHAPGTNGRETVPQIADAIRTMRDKIAREQARPRVRDLKSGAGGIIDVEFAAQYLQLVHGYEYAELRTQSTVRALSTAAGIGVGNGHACGLLVDGYRFLRRIENRMRIVHDRSVDRLPEGHDLELLAYRTGFANGRELTDACAQWMQEIRGAYDRVVRA